VRAELSGSAPNVGGFVGCKGLLGSYGAASAGMGVDTPPAPPGVSRWGFRKVLQRPGHRVRLPVRAPNPPSPRQAPPAASLLRPRVPTVRRPRPNRCAPSEEPILFEPTVGRRHPQRPPRPQAAQRPVGR